MNIHNTCFWTRFFFLKNLSFKIAMSGWTGVRLAGRHRASSEVYLLVKLFSKLYMYVTFILQWIAFIFGRDEVEDQ